MENNTSIENWRDEISEVSSATLKIQEGEDVVITFKDEGKNYTHSEYGTSIRFTVVKGEEEFSWYVNPNNFALLKQIKELGKLAGTSIKVSRVGSKKSDTRYTIETIKTE